MQTCPSSSVLIQPVPKFFTFTRCPCPAIFKLISCTIILLKWRHILFSEKMNYIAFSFSFLSFAAFPPCTFVIAPALKGKIWLSFLMCQLQLLKTVFACLPWNEALSLTKLWFYAKDERRGSWMGLHEGAGEPMSILKIKNRMSNRSGEGREEDGA